MIQAFWMGVAIGFASLWMFAVCRWRYWKRRSIRIERAYGGMLKGAAIVSARGPAGQARVRELMEQRSAAN